MPDGDESGKVSREKMISEASRQIRKLINDPASRLSVVVETGIDECYLLGTADAYLRLALAALEFVGDAQAKRTEQKLVGGIGVAGRSAFGEVFESGEVGVSSGWLAETAAEVKTLRDFMLRISPPPEQCSRKDRKD